MKIIIKAGNRIRTIIVSGLDDYRLNVCAKPHTLHKGKYRLIANCAIGGYLQSRYLAISFIALCSQIFVCKNDCQERES